MTLMSLAGGPTSRAKPGFAHRLPPLATGCRARVAWPHHLCCPARRSLASLPNDAPGT
jgi:hypothetical protein